jgi:hypothetical protein
MVVSKPLGYLYLKWAPKQSVPELIFPKHLLTENYPSSRDCQQKPGFPVLYMSFFNQSIEEWYPPINKSGNKKLPVYSNEFEMMFLVYKRGCSSQPCLITRW